MEYREGALAPGSTHVGVETQGSCDLSLALNKLCGPVCVWDGVGIHAFHFSYLK
jgi:hypothetical protein